MTPEDRAQLRELAEGKIGLARPPGSLITVGCHTLIALLDEVDRLEAENAGLRDALAPILEAEAVRQRRLRHAHPPSPRPKGDTV